MRVEVVGTPTTLEELEYLIRVARDAGMTGAAEIDMMGKITVREPSDE